MKKLSIIGHYAYGLEYLDGQTIKTKILTNELSKKFGETEVLKFDTHGAVKTLLKAPIYVFRAMKNSQNIIMLPAHNGLRIFGRLLPFFKIFFKKRKIHYVVIGGWLPNVLEKQKNLANVLKKFDGIYVETNTMKRDLIAKGFKNVFVMPNCKELTPLSVSSLVYQNEAPYKLCTFSRVMKEKGIEDAVEAVKAINQEFGKTIYTLDIYGQVDPEQYEWFDLLRENLPEYVNYCGLVSFDKSVEVLKDYFALLFPTKFYTEGIPGTIIDSYASGLPVISAKWESYSDVVAEGITGIGYDFNDATQLEKILLKVIEKPDDLLSMKVNCIHKAKDFSSESAIQVLIKNFDN